LPTADLFQAAASAADSDQAVAGGWVDPGRGEAVCADPVEKTVLVEVAGVGEKVRERGGGEEVKAGAVVVEPLTDEHLG